MPIKHVTLRYNANSTSERRLPLFIGQAHIWSPQLSVYSCLDGFEDLDAPVPGKPSWPVSGSLIYRP